MSNYADIIEIFSSAKDKYKLSEPVCISLFTGVIGALEWDLDDVNYDNEEWEELEYTEAQRLLFPRGV